MLDNFDFDILNDPDFKEDSVREEIIAPILKELGYKASGENRIIRSKKLTHPFVYIGSTKKQVYIIPDYLLEIQGKYSLILDAKAPNEDILRGKNLEQAYCYSIHPEIRVKYYCLCNGRELTVFDVSKVEPILYIKTTEIKDRWKEVYNTLSPLALTKPHLLGFYPDFGLSLLKSGWSEISEFHFVGAWANLVARLEDKKYTFFSNLKFGESDSYAASFDFSDDLYENFLEAVADDQKEEIRRNLSRQPYSIGFTKQTTFEIIIHAKFGTEVITNEDESYLPFEVLKFEPMPYPAEWSRLSLKK